LQFKIIENVISIKYMERAVLPKNLKF